MNYKVIWRQTVKALRANMKPALFLWSVMLLFVLAYLLIAPFRQSLAQVAELKKAIGYPFSATVYVLFAALLPEILSVACFQHWKATRQNVQHFLYLAVIWGCHGMVTDFFYRQQARWFGEGNDWQVVLCKVLADQLMFSPISNTYLLVFFCWWDEKFSSRAWTQLASLEFWTRRWLPMVVAMICIWPPGNVVIYSMPSPLQLPIASLILCFWCLILTFVSKREQ